MVRETGQVKEMSSSRGRNSVADENAARDQSNRVANLRQSGERNGKRKISHVENEPASKKKSRTPKQALQNPLLENLAHQNGGIGLDLGLMGANLNNFLNPLGNALHPHGNNLNQTIGNTVSENVNFGVQSGLSLISQQQHENILRSGQTEQLKPGWPTLADTVALAAAHIAKIMHPIATQNSLVTMPEEAQNSHLIGNESILSQVVTNVSDSTSILQNLLRNGQLNQVPGELSLEKLQENTKDQRAGLVSKEKSSTQIEAVDREALRIAIFHILSTHCAGKSAISPRTIRIASGKLCTIPNLIRTGPPATIYDAYKRLVLDYSYPTMSKIKFYTVLELFTGGDIGVSAFADFSAKSLVDNPCAILMRIIDNLDIQPEKVQHYYSQVNQIKKFLKFQFDSEVKHSQSSAHSPAIHDALFSLSPNNPRATRTKKCAKCDFPFRVLKQFKSLIQRSGTPGGWIPNPSLNARDALVLLDNIYEAFRSFQAHRIKIVTQQLEIEKVLSNLKERCLKENDSSCCIVELGWMKSSRTILAHSKTEMTLNDTNAAWQRARITFFRQKESGGPGMGNQGHQGEEPERVTVYLDQILKDNCRPGPTIVAALIEAMLEWMHTELPFLKSVILQSNNSKCYTSMDLIVFLKLLNETSPLRVERFIHTSCFSEKTMQDLQFEKTMEHLQQFMLKSKTHRCIQAIISPSALAEALAWNSGMQNCGVQLLSLDHSKLKDLATITSCTGLALQKRVGCCNDVHLLSCSESNVKDWDSIYKAIQLREKFTIRTALFAGLGVDIQVCFTLGSNKKIENSLYETLVDIEGEDLSCNENSESVFECSISSVSGGAASNIPSSSFCSEDKESLLFVGDNSSRSPSERGIIVCSEFDTCKDEDTQYANNDSDLDNEYICLGWLQNAIKTPLHGSPDNGFTFAAPKSTISNRALLSGIQILRCSNLKSVESPMDLSLIGIVGALCQEYHLGELDLAEAASFEARNVMLSPLISCSETLKEDRFPPCDQLDQFVSEKLAKGWANMPTYSIEPSDLNSRFDQINAIEKIVREENLWKHTIVDALSVVFQKLKKTTKHKATLRLSEIERNLALLLWGSPKQQQTLEVPQNIRFGTIAIDADAEGHTLPRVQQTSKTLLETIASFKKSSSCLPTDYPASTPTNSAITAACVTVSATRPPDTNIITKPSSALPRKPDEIEPRRRGRKSNIPQYVLDHLAIMNDQYPNIKPRDFIAKFRERFPGHVPGLRSGTFLSDDELKRAHRKIKYN